MKNRESNVELARIISMMMIIGLHYLNADMGGVLGNVEYGSINYLVAHLFESVFIVGVNIFVLITGYFLIDKEYVKVKNIINLYIIMIFYNIVFLVIGIWSGEVTFSIKECILSILPFLGGRRWFVQTYILLYVISPFLNVMLRGLSKRGYRLLLFIEIIVVIWASFLPNSPINDNGYGILNFIILYSISGYIKLHYKTSRSSWYYIKMYSFFIIVTFLFSFTKFENKAWGYVFISNILGAVMLFLFYKNISIENNKIINYISKFTFPIFLIHSDFSIRNIIYQRILKCNYFYYSNLFVLHLFLSIIIIFTLSMLIDIPRKKIFSLIINKKLNAQKINKCEIKAI